MQTPPGSASASSRAAMFTPLAVDAAVLDTHLTEVNANAELHLAVVRQRCIPNSKHGLDLEGTLHGLGRRRKLREHVVTGSIDDSALVLLDQVRDGSAVAGEHPDRDVLVLGHQPAVADRVGGEDRGEAALRAGHAEIVRLR